MADTPVAPPPEPEMPMPDTPPTADMLGQIFTYGNVSSRPLLSHAHYKRWRARSSSVATAVHRRSRAGPAGSQASRGHSVSMVLLFQRSALPHMQPLALPSSAQPTC